MTEQNPGADPQAQAQPQAAQAQAGDGAQPAQQAAPATQGDPAQQDEPQGTDWKAQARKWERQAKANKAKADMWDARAKDEPTVESLQEQIDGLRAEAEAARAESARIAAVARVSQETGVPSSLIQGDDEDAMKASAEAIAAFAKAQAPGYPADKGGAPQAGEASVESIESIKDPAERIRARARNIELYR